MMCHVLSMITRHLNRWSSVFQYPCNSIFNLLLFTSYPMPTLSIIDMESGTNNSITDALQVDDGSCSDVPYNMVIELKHPSNTHFTSSFSSEIFYSLRLTDYGFMNWEHLTMRNLFSCILKNLPPSYAQFCHDHQLAIVQSQILLWTVKSSGKIIIMLPQDNYFLWKYTFDIEQSTFMLANVILDKLERGAAKELCPELDFHDIANKPDVGSMRLSFIVASSSSESQKRMAGEELSLFPANLNAKVGPERFVYSIRLTNKLIVVSIICVL